MLTKEYCDSEVMFMLISWSSKWEALLPVATSQTLHLGWRSSVFFPHKLSIFDLYILWILKYLVHLDTKTELRPVLCVYVFHHEILYGIQK